MASVIKVNNIQNTESVDAITIDTAGRVSKSNIPVCHAYTTTGTHGSLGAGSATHVVWDSTTINIGGHYNTSTGLFTCPVGGIYLVSSWGMKSGSDSDGTVNKCQGHIQVNTNVKGGTYNYGDGQTHAHITLPVQASVGDTISAYWNNLLLNMYYSGFSVTFIG